MTNRSRKSLISLQGRVPFWSILAFVEGERYVTTVVNEALCDDLGNVWAVRYLSLRQDWKKKIKTEKYKKWNAVAVAQTTKQKTTSFNFPVYWFAVAIA